MVVGDRRGKFDGDWTGLARIATLKAPFFFSSSS